MSEEPASPARPLDRLGVLALQRVEVAPALVHVEMFTMDGLLTALWHGDPAAERVVVMAGGAMGGLLGPANGLYQRLGESLAKVGMGTLRVSYRRPNDLSMCILDLAAVCDLASRNGARAFIAVGHSFGGAVVLNLATVLENAVKGVVTLATQSAGCESVSLGDRPLLLIHGGKDELLAPACSEMVRALVGTGEIVLLPDAGHLMADSGDELMDRLGRWIAETFEGA